MINEYAEFRDIIRDIIREEIEKYFKQNSVEKKYGGIVTAIYPYIEIIAQETVTDIANLQNVAEGDAYRTTTSGTLNSAPDTISVQAGDVVIWNGSLWELEAPIDSYSQRCAVDLGFTTIGSSSPNEMILNKSGEVLNIGDSVSVYANSSGNFVNAYVGIKHTPIN